MKQITELHFNEDALCWMLVAVEHYMKEHKDCNQSIKESHEIFNKIWYKMQTDAEYWIAESPF